MADAPELLKEWKELLQDAKHERLLLQDEARAASCGFSGIIASDLDKFIKKIYSDIKNVVKRSSFTTAELDQLRGEWEEIHGRVCDLKLIWDDYLKGKVPVVGLEKHIKELLAELTKEGDTAHRVVCIWGMGGIGKTTLASQIYHHPEIRSHFAGFAWVTLSDNTFDLPGETPEIINKISFQLADTTDAMRTQGAISLVASEKYLVIIDDSWSKLKLRWIADNLLSKFLNIRLLLTTRNKGVTSYLGVSIFFHELRCLDEQQSWELFEKKANFKTHARESEYNEMKELGEKMLECCAGLPLAISMLGEILSEARTTSEWHDIMFAKVKKNVREGKTKKQGELKNISRVLGLSYHDLPGKLSRCFLYLAHFPKDTVIRVKELCRIWAVERFLLCSRWSADLEEMAYENIDKLVQRSMVQVEKLDLHGRIKALRIHNLMRQLCLVKAEGFVKIINSRNMHEEAGVFFDDFHNSRNMHDEFDYWPPYFVPTDRKPSRISIYLNKEVAQELLPLIGNVYRHGSLESLMCFSRLLYPSYEQVMKPLLERFRELRVLKFENLAQGYIGNLPEEIGELSSLRFLSLKGSHVEQVPSSIGNFVSLQTLDLRTKWTLKLPDVIWKLEQLKHLYLGHRSYISGNNLRLGDPRRLRTLVNIPLMCCNFNDLIELTQLKNLKFYVHAKWWKEGEFGSNIDFDLQSLAVENLSRARIDLTPFISNCPRVTKLRLEGKIEKLTEDKYFPNLIKLTLNRTDLEDDPMTTLGKLPNLRFLLLKYNAFKGNAMACSSGDFPRLESLSLVELEQLREWRIEKGALPSLGYLLIEYCYELEAIPDGLRFATSLKKLVIKRMPREFEMKVVRSGNDFYKKDQRVPDIEILDDEPLYCQL